MDGSDISTAPKACCSALDRCPHCGSDVPKGKTYCCSGCEAAHAARDAATADAPTGFAALAQKLENGAYRLELGVEGIHCASCIRLIENALAPMDGVVSARVNMTTERLAVTWEGAQAYGNDLAEAVTRLGYKLHPLDDSADAASGQSEEKRLLKSIAVAGFAAGNLMLLSVGLWTTTIDSMGMATRDLMHWISALIALPTVAYAGQPFFRSALAVLKEKHTNMDVPISLAVTLACVMSLSEAYRHGEHVYFDSAVMLLFFLLIGRYLDARAKGKARESASKLLSRLAGLATVLDGGKTSQVPIRDLKEGMHVIVAAGENIPADGEVIKGTSAIDMSLISGESVPVAVEAGKAVFAGTLNISAPIELTVTKASEKSLLSEIVRLLETAEQAGAKYVRLADRAAQLYTPVVHTLGLITFLGWWLLVGAEWQVSLLHAVTVLIITCPCALGLAVPVVQVLASSKLMRAGILLKSGDALERLAVVDTVVFDKTGTLTVGRPTLVSNGHADADLRLAASMAARSKHPLSKAIVAAYSGETDSLDIEEVPGRGLEAKVDGKPVRLGSRGWCGDDAGGAADAEASLELWLNVDGRPVTCFRFSDKPRADARDVVTALKARGLKVVLLSGDRAPIVEAVAREAGIDLFEAEVSPVEKCAVLDRLKAEGDTILMVGDGLNDAPALASAQVSMSPSTAIDITQNTADIVFQGDKLAPVMTAITTASFSTVLVKQNFALAILYNIVAIPLAILGYVTPMVAAAAMSGSSLAVIANAFRLNFTRRA